jgi:GMP synthase (glutamine-hydrolysing)
MSQEWIAILDFGSQYTQLIARRVRELKVYCEILPCHTPLSELQARPPRGVILSGGPGSVYDQQPARWDPQLLDAGWPILGICYGLQAICHQLGGRVARSEKREYGHARIARDLDDPLLAGIPPEFPVWMSHGDRVEEIPEGFAVLAHSSDSPTAAVGNAGRKIYGVQFHPEVTHTPDGKALLRNFLHGLCGCSGRWSLEDFMETSLSEIRARVGSDAVILGLSGGVDSSVAAALLSRAVGRRLHCIFVDNGLLRAGEREQVVEAFRKSSDLSLHVNDATVPFLRSLRNVTDPEQKRKIIGRLFIEVFKGEAMKIEGARFLAQGTLYPDVIESRSPFGGPSAVIKTHHNVGGLPEELGFELIEPLRFLFKDEVRSLGKALGLPAPILERHPFPGPGLAVRIPGEITAEGLEIVRKADLILIDEIRRAGWYDRLWQAFVVLLPVRSVGVMGDARTYDRAASIRAVQSDDGMTADWAELPHDLLKRISNRIINEVRGINRVVYDISSKPPATIEWE